jgi:hypothetical protein
MATVETIKDVEERNFKKMGGRPNPLEDTIFEMKGLMLREELEFLIRREI